MFTIETVGQPISQGLRISVSKDCAVFARCRYDAAPISSLEFSGLELASYLEGERSKLLDTDNIFLFDFRSDSDRWTEVRKGISWLCPDGDMRFLYKDITDSQFRIDRTNHFYEESILTIHVERVTNMAIHMTFKSCATLEDLVTGLAPPDYIA
jgi:hypothetical protein